MKKGLSQSGEGEAILSRSDLLKMSGASPSTVSRALKNGDLPGGYRHDGLHWLIPLSPAVTAWCRDQKRKRKLLSLPPANLNKGLGKGTAIITIEGIRQFFDIWKRKADIAGWDITQIDKAIMLLSPFADLLEQLQDLREKKSARILR